MRGDKIIVELHHRQAGKGVVDRILQSNLTPPFGITVGGESGSGKSEIAQAIADELGNHAIQSIILGQDDYFIYPPRTNDTTRRADISWVGTQEVNLTLLDDHMGQILAGCSSLEKPLVIYDEDRIESESIPTSGVNVVIAEGTYVSQLTKASVKVFIDRSFEETRAHREKRMRHASELDPFIDKVLKIEHEIISAHKKKAHVVIDTNYQAVDGPLPLS
ncbi:MAG: zeta toxin family protein [Magnetococcales bacterium]|nr:zeta toxin family protein [Magnetococcales bacterium]